MVNRFFRSAFVPRASVLGLVVALCLAVASQAQGALLVNLGYSYLRLLQAGDVVHHELRVSLDPAQFVARFTDDVTIHLIKSTDVVYMTLGSDYILDEVSMADGQKLRHGRHFLNIGALPFTIYRIDLPRHYQRDTELTLRFSYHISPETAVNTFPYLSDRLFFATISMFWYPQMPTEGFFTATVHLDDAPGYLTLVGEGAPEEGTDGRSWRTVKPVPGFGLAIGEFVPIHQEVDGRDVYTWHPPFQPGHARSMGQRAGEAVTFLEGLLGPLPLERLDIVALPYGLGGSTGQYSWFIYDEMNMDIPLDNPVMLTYMAAHEAAHKWIGFTAGTQVLGTTWITEGLTDYLAFLTVQEIHGTEGMRHVIEARAITPLSQQTGRLRAVSAIEITDADVGVAFQKGALVFRTLHRRLGDEAFFALLRTFIDEYTLGHASSRNFTDLINREGGQAVRRFVTDWINGNQELDYAIESVRVTPSGSGQRLEFRVVSKGRLTEPGPADVEITLADGTVRMVEVELGQQASFEFDVPVRRVVVDPDYWTVDWRRENNVWQA